MSIMDKIEKFEERLHKEKVRKAIKVMVIRHYSNDTMRCTNPDCEVPGGARIFECLTIDHPNGGGNKHRREIKKTGTSFYLWLILNSFPPEFTILCMNCQFIKRLTKTISLE